MNLTYTLGTNGFYLLDRAGDPIYIEVADGVIYRVNPQTLARESTVTRDDLDEGNVFGAVRITGRGPAA